MNPLAYRLQYLDVDRSRTTVVAVVVCLTVTHDALGTLRLCESVGSLLGYPGDNVTCVEGEDLRVGIDCIGIEDLGKLEGTKERPREVACEGILIRTAWATSRPMPDYEVTKNTDLVYLRALAVPTRCQPKSREKARRRTVERFDFL